MSNNYVLEGQTKICDIEELNKQNNSLSNPKLEYIIDIRNSAYNIMMDSQYMLDLALNELEKSMASYMYKVGWGMYNLMLEFEKIEKRKNKKPDFTNHG